MSVVLKWLYVTDVLFYVAAKAYKYAMRIDGEYMKWQLDKRRVKVKQ